MGKSFEVTYSPSSWNAPTGGVASSWTTPYGGLNTLAPENLIGPQFTPAMDNIMLRNSELTSRPLYRQYLPSPIITDGKAVTSPVLGIGSFFSIGQRWHTVCWNANGLHQLSANSDLLVQAGTNPWTQVSNPALLYGPTLTFRTFQGILYWSDFINVWAWAGTVVAPIQVAFFGATVPPAIANEIGCLYIMELDNHLILAYTNEGQTTIFPQRVRWSNIGFNPFDAGGIFGGNLGTAGATFDPTINVNAGFNDFLDVPDAITGLMAIGRMGYVFRQNGITEMSPTGKGVAPFDFNHLWASERGIGNLYSNTIAQYGNVGMFISEENIYKISPQSLLAVGGGARDRIIQDLTQTIDVPKCYITPALSSAFPYLVYQLFIPLRTGDTRVYVYSFDDNNWMSWTVPGQLLGLPGLSWVSNPTTQNVFPAQPLPRY